MMNTFTNASNKTDSTLQHHDVQSFNSQSHIPSLPNPELDEVLQPSHKSSMLLRNVLEGFLDGILILTNQGRLIAANNCALQLCRQFLQDPSLPNQVPEPIWQICQSLIESRTLFSEQTIVIEDELSTGQSSIRIRVRWVDWHDDNHPYLLIALEDRHQILMNAAIAEASKYGLTAREAEVWLLRRANRAYKDIAAELNIAIDTVKKHVKSIHAKRNAFLWANE